MWRGQRIAVVIPAFNEAEKIARTVRSVPGFVDHVIVVDDASRDSTARLARRSRRRGIEVLQHECNQGVGAAILTGYRRALVLGADVTAVMAGDSQMDPADLPAVLEPVIAGRVEYAKGNRFLWPAGWRAMPMSRLLGNVVLSVLTRLVTGYGRLFDSQCGYTAASRVALAAIVSGRLFPRYGYPIDVLVRLAARAARVTDVPVRPLYGPEWRSGIRIPRVVGPLLFVLGRGLLRRALRALLGPGARSTEPIGLATDEPMPGARVSTAG
jgi:glycosyltransferase involved in cell wall biosynthesis